MPRSLRKCSECGKRLEGKINQVTCSDACRSRRAARMKRSRAKAAENISAANQLPEHMQAVRNAADDQAQDVGRELLKEEMRPVVREAITDDVMEAVSSLVKLTPTAVQRLALDLESSDDNVRQRAYTLVLKYSMGNPSVAPAPKPPEQPQTQIIVSIPRPDAPLPAEDSTAVEERECAECSQMKTDFVGDSDRCTECHEKYMAQVRERFG
jgi:hypothetical protein